MLAGKIDTKARISERISSSDPIPSTRPFVLWYTAEDVSHFAISFPGSALGELRNYFAFFSSINVKSVSAGTTESPPPHVPKIAVICGITPEAIACF